MQRSVAPVVEHPAVAARITLRTSGPQAIASVREFTFRTVDRIRYSLRGGATAVRPAAEFRWLTAKGTFVGHTAAGC